MQPHQARKLAHKLMNRHGLIEWQFAFNHAKRTLGLCRHVDHRIELSLHFVVRNDESAVRDTILHEIAHALAGRDACHGPAWKAKCIEIGARPERLDHDSEMPEGPWRATCPACGERFTRHRRPARNRRYSCRRCGPTRGQLSFQFRSG